MSFDESSFNKHFEIIHPKDFETNGQKTPYNDVPIQSLKIVNKEFIHEIEEALKAFENFLIGEFSSDVIFNYVS